MIIMLYYIYKMLLDIQRILHQCPNIYLFRMKRMVRSKLISVTKFVLLSCMVTNVLHIRRYFEQDLINVNLHS